jgi:hypothetical protein
VDLLSQHRDEGRRWAVEEVWERGDALVAHFQVVDPQWPTGPLDIYKAFWFRPTDERIVRMQDCVDLDEAFSWVGGSTE